MWRFFVLLRQLGNSVKVASLNSNRRLLIKAAAQFSSFFAGKRPLNVQSLVLQNFLVKNLLGKKG